MTIPEMNQKTEINQMKKVKISHKENDVENNRLKKTETRDVQETLEPLETSTGTPTETSLETENTKVKVLFSSMLNNNTDNTENGQNNGVIGLKLNGNSSNSGNSQSYFIPVSSTTDDLNLLLNSVLSTTSNEEDDQGNRDYNFYVNDQLILKSLNTVINDQIQSYINAESINNNAKTGKLGTESTFVIKYIPKSVFKVRSVNRCSSTMTGHSQPVLALAYSPNGRMLASGSGDNSVRLWDLATETPRACLTGHTGWVQHVAWSPEAAYVCSAGMDGKIGVWEAKKGTLVGFIKAHTQPITSLTFEPFHLNPSASRFVSTSKDGTAKVWDLHHRSNPISILSGHTAPVTCSVWSGHGVIYTGSRDKTIKKWSEDRLGGGFSWKGEMKGHGHWVNRLALQSDFICKTGPFDHTDPVFVDNQTAHKTALARYTSFMKTQISQQTGDLLASCSDDFTIILWPTRTPTTSTTTKPINRMTGHQQPVNSLCFSPDGSILASASFDKSVKLWRITGGATVIPGHFLDTLRGHVGAVYQVSFSSDSRKLASASRDSTVKIWNIEFCLSMATNAKGVKSVSSKGKMVGELSGHEDEVWCVEWAPDGSGVCSGGKDKSLKIWKH